MNVAEFDFDLPPDRIATRPAHPRDAARMLVVGEGLADRTVADLPQQLRRGDLLVFNDTRVIPARLAGLRTAARGTAKVEITLNRPVGGNRWSVLARPAKRLKVGDALQFGAGLNATVAECADAGEVILEFAAGVADVIVAVERGGAMPLPPYMGRDADAADRTDYQTVYARDPGAVAAPTAGLHFTPQLLDALADAGVGRAFVTLHVGTGTFLPVKVEDTDDHVMHPERGEVSAATAAAINAARAAGGTIVAVGTTSLRLLETAAAGDGTIRPFRGETSAFFVPGHRFRSAARLLTNFHLPRSTLFMLVCAFAGTGRMHAAYAHAIRTGYRFYSYGDCCLLDRA